MPFSRATDIVIHYCEDGEGWPPIVQLHSLGTDSRIWDGVARALRRSHLVLRYDLRGHGLTDATPPPYSIDGLVQDLSELLDERGVASAVLCGISIGGQIALRLAARDPGRLAALVLCDTAASIGDEALWNARIAAIESGGLSSIADSVLARWFAPSFRETHPADYGGYRNLLLRTPAEGYVGVAAALRDADGAVLTSAARSVRVPTLVLCGTEDAATPPHAVRELAESIPGARYELVPGAGHLPPVEQPEAVARAIRSFLD
jgi:3-oxoadipate enol-lactonase